VRLKNQLVPGKVGSWTLHLPEKQEMYIYDAAMKYVKDKVPLIVIAGKEYGTGSSRDWAAKGTQLLGVQAVISESFERIHRSNLIGMGVLPLQFKEGENAKSLGLDGTEIYDLLDISKLQPASELKVVAHKEDGTEKIFNVIVRLNSSIEVEYFRNGGILHRFLREKVKGN
jgi:aconitate hydratase